MLTPREPYVRPVVMRLEYTTDVRVSTVTGCKLESSDVGPSVQGCVRTSVPIGPCNDIVS
jgi:hypothetical protein